MSDDPHVVANIERFLGFAAVYDQARPTPSQALIPILLQLAQTPRPTCVVDIGSGTGLSTRLWAANAEHVIGIEPNDDMRGEAETRSAALSNVRYQKGLSIATGLPDASADIVTVSQALHWMEPTGTFIEIARLLRPGGVFAAIDNDFPPTVHWEAEMVERTFSARMRRLVVERELDKNSKHWDKHEHLKRMAASEQFRYTKEIALSSTEQGNGERMVAMVLSQSPLQALLKSGMTAEEIGIPAFRADMQRILGEVWQPFYFTYRVRIGVK